MSENDDGLILNLSFDQPAVPKPVSATSLRKQYVIEGGSKFERQMIRRAIKTKSNKERGIEESESNDADSENKPKSINEIPLGKRRSYAEKKAAKTSKPTESKGDTSVAAQFRKKRKLEQEKNSQAAPKEKKSKVIYKEKREGEDGSTFVSSLFRADDLKEIEDREDDVEEEMETALPSNAPSTNSASSFEGLGVSEGLTKVMYDKMQLVKPTRIQRAVIPKVLSGKDRDLFVQAQTGSGKTLAYSLPIMQRLIEQGTQGTKINRDSGLFGIILAPTRELAAQIYNVLVTLQQGCHWLVPGIVSGGEKKKSEKARIRKGVNVLVATPGRLADHMDTTESLDLSGVRWLVLDECDRLMELGFEETITKILKALDTRSQIARTAAKYPILPKKRINILCSATVKGKVKELGEASLTDADWVTVESVSNDEEDDGESSRTGNNSGVIDNPSNYTAPAQLLQRELTVPAKLRLVTLAAELRNIAQKKKTDGPTRVIVFFSCSDSVNFHFSVFTRAGKSPTESSNKTEDDQNEEKKEETNSSLSTVLTAPWLSKNAVIHKLHGSLSQATRTATLRAFFGKKGKKEKENTNKVSVLFCTDVASRGLDLPHITDVIEYDPPFATDDHIHRVGRTARAGKAGQSVIFLLPGNEEKYLDVISPYHPTGIKKEKYENFLRKAFAENVGSASVNTHQGQINWEVEATTWHLNIERWLLEDAAALFLAKKGFMSHVRAYATHLSSQRNIFNLKELHLGHLAKSFGLRETPGNMSNKKKKDGQKGARGKKSNRIVGTDNDEDFGNHAPVSEADGRKTLMAKARKLYRASEFNIGY